MRSLGGWIQSEPLKLHHREGLFLAGPTTGAERRDADKYCFGLGLQSQLLATARLILPSLISSSSATFKL